MLNTFKKTLAFTLLFAFACTASATNILVWSSGNSNSSTASVASWIQLVGGYTTVDGINADYLSSATLDSYDRVLYFSNGSSIGNVDRGNALADFADTGKRLVLSTFSWAQQGGNTLEGRIVTDELSPFFYQGSSLYSNVTMSSNDGSAFFTDVNSLSGYYHDNVGLTTGSISRATWSDGESLLATKGNVVGVNLFPAIVTAGDFKQLFVNALGAEVGVPAPASVFIMMIGLFGVIVRRITS